MHLIRTVMVIAPTYHLIIHYSRRQNPMPASRTELPAPTVSSQREPRHSKVPDWHSYCSAAQEQRDNEQKSPCEPACHLSQHAMHEDGSRTRQPRGIPFEKLTYPIAASIDLCRCIFFACAATMQWSEHSWPTTLEWCCQCIYRLLHELLLLLSSNGAHHTFATYYVVLQHMVEHDVTEFGNICR